MGKCVGLFLKVTIPALLHSVSRSIFDKGLIKQKKQKTNGQAIQINKQTNEQANKPNKLKNKETDPKNATN